MKNGFTIIELLITIFILSVGVIGIYSAFSAMIVFTNNASDQLQAAYLAQEGIEIIRNIRDTNWLQPEGWTSGLDSCVSGCKVDYTSTGELLEVFFPGDYLKKDNDGFYRQMADGDPSKFQRKIIITPVLDQEDHAVDVVVEVSWDKKKDLISEGATAGGECQDINCVQIQETLYDWY